MFKTTTIACAVAVACAANVHPREHYEKEFFEHVQKFKLELKDGAEFLRRLSVFADNYDVIEKHNAEGHTYKFGLNQFSHLTYDEWIDTVKVGGTRIPNLRRNPNGPLFDAPEGVSNPTTVDWVSAGAVTPVKNQGNCGSCWSFSTTGAVEGAYQIAGNALTSFSEQQLVSCDTKGGDAGCNGGWMDDAFTYLETNALTTEANYPYTSGDTGKSGSCTWSGTGVTKVKGYSDVKTGSVSALETAVAQQPVSIAIQANQPAFQHYTSGVLTGTCGQRLDHGVLAVGYGVDNGTPYWKVKNSWGPQWGENGYIRILKSDADLCGVLDAPSFPSV
jgi:KDEL-tailed cysteine endopeptidase